MSVRMGQFWQFSIVKVFGFHDFYMMLYSLRQKNPKFEGLKVNNGRDMANLRFLKFCENLLILQL